MLFLVVFQMLFVDRIHSQVNCLEQFALVRLYMNKPKLDYYTLSINKASAQKEKEYFQNQILKHIDNRKAYSQKVIQLFKHNYVNAEKLRFIPDSLWNDFEKGIVQPYFYNERGDLDTMFVNPSEFKYYIIARGDYDEDFIAIDKEKNILPFPFPSKVKHSILSKINTVVGDGMKVTIERYCKNIKKYCSSMK